MGKDNTNQIKEKKECVKSKYRQNQVVGKPGKDRESSAKKLKRHFLKAVRNTFYREQGIGKDDFESAVGIAFQ